MADKKVAEATASDLIPFDDDLLSAGTGLEEASADDYAIPFLRVLQSMSPQLKKSDGKYIQGAEEGNLFNTVTETVYDGTEGVVLIPCAYKKKFIEWITRENGGGFVDDSHPATILKSCKKDDSGRFILENGNQISETAEYYCIVAQDENAPEQVLLSLTSSQLGFSRRWNTMLNNARVQNAKGETVPAPMFSYMYNLTTIPQSNDQYSWMGLSVEKSRPTPMPLAVAALEFMKAARSGDVEVRQEQEGVNASADVGEEEVPF
tara:strand:+ start:2696 stop:3484 length:789 start_codon:yes stop_codon:yes gene_type:complete